MNNIILNQLMDIALLKLTFLMDDVNRGNMTTSEALESLIGHGEEDDPYKFGDLLRNKLEIDIMAHVWAWEVFKPTYLIHDIILPNVNSLENDPFKDFREELEIYLKYGEEDKLWFELTEHGYKEVSKEKLSKILEEIEVEIIIDQGHLQKEI